MNEAMKQHLRDKLEELLNRDDLEVDRVQIDSMMEREFRGFGQPFTEYKVAERFSVIFNLKEPKPTKTKAHEVLK